jgi:hypothetical protein
MTPPVKTVFYRFTYTLPVIKNKKSRVTLRRRGFLAICKP